MRVNNKKFVSTQKGAAFVEATVFVSILFIILLSGLSMTQSLRDRGRANEALYRSALKIIRLTSDSSRTSLPDRIDLRCSILKDLIKDELRRESVEEADIKILASGSSSVVQQIIAVEIPPKGFFGAQELRLQVSTQNHLSPVDCSAYGSIQTGL